MPITAKGGALPMKEGYLIVKKYDIDEHNNLVRLNDRKYVYVVYNGAGRWLTIDAYKRIDNIGEATLFEEKKLARQVVRLLPDTGIFQLEQIFFKK